MVSRRSSLRIFILVLILVGISCLLRVARLEAAPSLLAPSATQTLVLTVTPTQGHPGSGIVIPTPIPIPAFPLDSSQRTRAATASPAPSAAFQTYTVEPGDSYYKIAQKVYGDGTKYPLILRANNLSDISPLSVGTVLRIPPLGGSESVATRTSTPGVGLPNPLLPNRTVTSLPTMPPTGSAVPLIVPGQPTEPARAGPVAPRDPDAETGALLSALINLTSGTLLLSSMICGFLSYVVFKRTQRTEHKRAMVLRIRPPSETRIRSQRA
jgi:LysM repeat protein